MVFIKFRCNPGDEKAILNIWMTTSQPILSLSALNTSSSTPVLEFQIHIQCVSSVHPDRPLTICTSGSILDETKPECGHMDQLALGKLSGGLVCSDATDGTRKVISFGFFYVHRARQDNDRATDLRKRPDVKFITVPAQESGKSVTVTHTLSSERLFAFAEKISPQDLNIGEKYSTTLSDRNIGTMWWCWGDLDNDLRGKKFHPFSEGFCCAGTEEKPSDEEIEKSGWVTGENVAKLKFELDAGRARCSVEVVE
ncbi:hypothetical protein P153DRAFT_435478 [Dothidotthia symphoricarpi CBS 119687]|uniref:Uncharacterized protein n=1 Tax=Dothidotthia symphoricarpi CBS 119687 TaxID=1392245 RepID=A0A6A5ZXQ8_9PLEO|nr:uncharacterized protein P153DRAFT_435478 [Dothidotthia symphoricarpi CBS 119687]KAF2124319.1 hypothetical protein P153DRAFT_435478 [Dothidotthia symphoricarpi CBS 119687]